MKFQRGFVPLLCRIGLVLIAGALPIPADMAAGERAYRNGDFATALKEFLPLAKQGVADAQFWVGLMYDLGRGVPKDYSEAIKWYRAAASQGDTYAQFNLGVMLEGGEGGPRDCEQAAKWYRLAAEKGNPRAQFRLGMLYHSGSGVPANYDESLKWLRTAAEQGDVKAASWLGFRYEVLAQIGVLPDSRNQRITRDSKEAARWYRLAAEQGDGTSQVGLGRLYLEGHGVPQDDVEAVKWFLMAASQGNPSGQLELGRMYKDGRGVPQDYIQAHMWANLAASHGPAEVSALLSPEDAPKMRRYYTALREELAALMTPAQLAEAHALARDWKPTKTGVPPGSDGPKATAPSSSGAEVFAGTGFLVDRRGSVVTNHHVVDGCAQIDVFSPTARQRVGIIADDKRNDLAVIGPTKEIAGSLAFGGQRPRLGQSVVVVGYPLQGILASSISVTTGTVSALAGLRDDTRMVQITAPVQPGNSGGPLLDQGGAVIGIVTSKLDAVKTAELVGDIPQYVNFAIREATVRSFLDASGIEYSIQSRNANLDTVTVAERARRPSSGLSAGSSRRAVG